MPMSLRPISTICWEGHTPPVLFVMADGKSFRLLDLGDERARSGRGWPLAKRLIGGAIRRALRRRAGAMQACASFSLQ